jgi:hypothetical protein
MLRWGQAAMQVIGPMNRRTEESFPIAGELYGWCSDVTADDLAPGSVGRGIFEAEARGDIPPGTAGHIIALDSLLPVPQPERDDRRQDQGREPADRHRHRHRSRRHGTCSSIVTRR